jgi:hypothetical protein
MSYELNVRLDGNKIEDHVAKIIALSINGCTYEEIQAVALIKMSIIYNEVSKLYSLLGLPKGINVLNDYALNHGFDYQYRFDKRDILTKEDIQRGREFVPRIFMRNTEIVLTLRPKQ